MASTHTEAPLQGWPNKDKADVQGKSANNFECELCHYSCEKLPTLKKHMESKHTGQKCKLCGKEFKTAMDLVIHASQEHHEQEEEEDVPLQSTPKSDKEGKKSNFVLSDSMLDG